MSRKDRLATWSQPPSKTEQDRIVRTERAIRQALNTSPDYRVSQATIFAKGSVKARTNIRNGSDIDLAIKPKDVFFSDYPSGYTKQDYGHSNSGYSFMTFRQGVLNALQTAFGRDVIEGNKSLKVRANFSGTRIDADIVPGFEYRHYTQPPLTARFSRGLAFYAKDNPSHLIHNWPHHNYENTILKQKVTSQRYRKCIRITKWLRHFMLKNGYTSAEHAASFLIESLMWNVPVHLFGNASIEDDMILALKHLREKIVNVNEVALWKEVNEMKYLFTDKQKWTLPQTQAFVFEASKYFDEMS